MKKTVLLLILIISSLTFTFAQVSTVPTIPTAASEVTINFDATGTGLDGYTGDVYAHTGVTVNGARWQNVIADWGVNTSKAKLTRTATNLYELVITPNVYTFYDVATSETISEFNFVFRSSDGSQQTVDLFVQIYEEGLNITFTEPLNGSAYNKNTSINIAAEASINADLELFVNGVSQETASNTNNISTSIFLTSTGNYTLKATATSGNATSETEISIYVKSPTQNQARPTGVSNGFNNNGDGTATFVLLAPNKNDVLLIGDFNDWTVNENYQLYKDGEYFWITLNNLNTDTEYAYQYLIDYEIKVADPYSEKILDPWTDQFISDSNYPNLKEYPINLTEGYVSTFKINEEHYTWQEENFTRPNQENLIIYELHVRDFTISDSFTEVISKLDYLEGLGINAIELMPINEFEGADSWGYNPALYFALDKAYGTKNAFKTLVDECHKRGIAVLADVVFNHSYGQSPLVQMYWNNVDNKPAADNPWYNTDHNFVDNPDAHWGSDFNHESPYTVSFFNEVLEYWMTEYKIDGFRFDFTKGFSNTIHTSSDPWGGNYDAKRIEILKNYANVVWNHNPSNKPYVIFEHLSNNDEETELANYGIMLWGNMNHSYNQNTMGYSSDSDISWISYKNRGWNTPNLIGYMESHDEERLMYKNLLFGNANSDYNVKNLTTALAREELAGMFLFTIPGPKMIWQFGELGYDKSINENGRVGRKPVLWEYENDVNRKHIYNTWSTLIELKKQLPVFNTADYNLNVGSLVKSITLKDDEMDVIIIGNFDIVEKDILVNFTKNGTWYEYFTGKTMEIPTTSNVITLTPGEYKLFATKRLLDPRGGTANDDSDGDRINDIADLCPNTKEGIQVDENGCPIFDLSVENFTIEVISETCPNKNNGQINITSKEDFNFTTTINNIPYSFSNELNVSDLPTGNYDFCIEVIGETYTQCYSITIEAGSVISGKTSVSSNKMEIVIEKGTAPYFVSINGIEMFETNSPSFSVDVKNADIVEVKTAVSCEGKISEKVELFDAIIAYPNPNFGVFEVSIPTDKNKVLVEIYNLNSQLISSKTYNVISKKLKINIENMPIGLYIAKVYLAEPKIIKIIKQ